MNTFLLESSSGDLHYKVVRGDNERLLAYLEVGSYEAYLIKKGSRGPVLKKVTIGDEKTVTTRVTAREIFAGGEAL